MSKSAEILTISAIILFAVFTSGCGDHLKKYSSNTDPAILLKTLESGDAPDRIAACDAFISKGPDAIPAILDDWVNGTFHRELIIRSISVNAVEPLTKYIESESDPAKIWPALEALSYTGQATQATLSVVIGELDNPDSYVKQMACRTLTMITYRTGISCEALLPFLINAKSIPKGKVPNELVNEAAFALGRASAADDNQAIDALKPLVAPDADPDYKPCAAFALYELGWQQDDMFSIIENIALKPPALNAGWRRDQALHALALIHSDLAVNTLYSAFENADDSEKDAVLLAIMDAEPDRANVPLLTTALWDKGTSTQGLALMELIRMGRDAAPAFADLKLLASGNGPRVVNQAYESTLDEALLRIKKYE
jgi:hypothetical protein